MDQSLLTRDPAGVKFPRDYWDPMLHANLLVLEFLKSDWEKRLKASEEELRREPARIRESYVVKARRIEPVGLVYLWPISG